MSDLESLESLEARLADQLHAHELPEALPGLARESERRGARIRRRRRVGAVAGLVAAVVVVPGAAWLIATPADRSVPMPVAPITATPKPPKTGTVTVNVTNPGKLPVGPAAAVDTVQEGRWVRADSSAVSLEPIYRGDTWSSYLTVGGGLFAAIYGTDSSTDPTKHLFVDANGRQQELSTEANNFEHGANGSVVWADSDKSSRTTLSIAALHGDGTVDHLSVPLQSGRGHGEFAVSGDYLFVPDGSAVYRYRVDGTTVTDRTKVPGAEGVNGYNQQALGRITLYDDDACSVILDAETLATILPANCGKVGYSKQSADGRFVLSQTSPDRLDILDVGSGRIVMKLKGYGYNATSSTFDTEGRFVYVSRVPSRGGADSTIVVCDVDAGACHRVAPVVHLPTDTAQAYSVVE